MVHGDRAESLLDRQPRQVVEDRSRDVELALVLHLQQRESDKRLADRPDLEQVVCIDWLAGFAIRPAVGQFL